MRIRPSSLVMLTSVLMLSGCLTPTGFQDPAEVVSYGNKGGAGSAGIHTVLEGDTVYTVSQAYHLPLRDIIALNDLSAPYALKQGFRLKLPPPNEYKVQEGDTLNRIGRTFDVSVSQIASLNDLQPPYAVSKGRVLRLPSRQPELAQEFAGDNDQKAGAYYGVSSGSGPSGAFYPQEQIAPPVGVASVERETLAPPPGMSAAAAPSSIPVMKGAGTPVIASGSMPPQPVARSGVSSMALPPPVTQSPATVARKGIEAAPVTAPVKSAPVATPVVAPASTASAIKPSIPARAGAKFMWPVDGKVISGYGPKADGLHNDGVNIKVPRGTAVRAADNGVVVYAGKELQGYGNLVLIRHANRWMTAYAHLDKILVKKGDTLKQGQSLGTVGSTGQVDSPQLHFEIRRGTEAINPQLYM